MRRERNSNNGTTIVVEHPRELPQLRPSTRRRIPRPIQRLFAGYPDSLRELSALARRKPLAGALQRWAQGRCELEINHLRPPRRELHEIYARIGLGPSTQVLLSGSLRPPRHCPETVAEVLRLIGVVRWEYNSAWGLLYPRDQRSLTDVVREHERMLKGSLGDFWSEPDLPRDPGSYFAFYEDSGQYVFADKAGRGWQYSQTGGDFGSVRSVGRWLDEFFTSRTPDRLYTSG